MFVFSLRMDHSYQESIACANLKPWAIFSFFFLIFFLKATTKNTKLKEASQNIILWFFQTTISPSFATEKTQPLELISGIRSRVLLPENWVQNCSPESYFHYKIVAPKRESGEVLSCDNKTIADYLNALFMLQYYIR